MTLSLCADSSTNTNKTKNKKYSLVTYHVSHANNANNNSLGMEFDTPLKWTNVCGTDLTPKLLFYPYITLITRPCVAWAVLQTPLQLLS